MEKYVCKSENTHFENERNTCVPYFVVCVVFVRCCLFFVLFVDANSKIDSKLYFTKMRIEND